MGEALLTTLAIFFFVIWIWIVITILMDLFRDHEVSGWAKAVWVLFLIFIPFLTALIYLIARGSGMRDRAIKEQADAKKHFDEYVRETAVASPVDELHKLDQLKQSGGLTDEEYSKMKAKIVG
ncbi:MAG: SHOCT domain-containing protein [Solirubrobacterales bacterium]